MFLVLAYAGASFGVTGAETSTWTDTTGTDTIQAELASFDGSTVTLKKADGKTVALKDDLLSKEELAFILSHSFASPLEREANICSC